MTSPSEATRFFLASSTNLLIERPLPKRRPKRLAESGLTKYYSNATVGFSWRPDLLAGIPQGYAGRHNVHELRGKQLFDTLKRMQEQGKLHNQHFSGCILGMLFAAFNRLSRDRTAFETNAETINSLMVNQLRSVSAFSPVFSEGTLFDLFERISDALSQTASDLRFYMKEHSEFTDVGTRMLQE
jgi:hypothetical protein